MKNLALKQAIGQKQMEFIELAFGEGAPAGMLGRESRENLIWRVNSAFKENWFARYDYEQGADEPNYEGLETLPWLRQGEGSLYRVYQYKPDDNWWLTCVGQ